MVEGGGREVVDRMPVYYSIGHLMIPGGDSKQPWGKYVLAMNKITKRQFATVDRLYSSEDQLEGARAFAEKRNPIWKGK